MYENNRSPFQPVPQLKHINYEDKLEFYQNVRQWHNKFIYRQFDISDLKSIHLENNEKFIQLKESILSFNKSLQQAEISKITPTNCPSRYSFYSKILQLLREALMVSNKESQEEFINKIYNWHTQEQNRNIKSRCKHSSSVEMKQESSNFEGTTNDETKRHFDLNDPKMPSSTIHESLKDFQNQQRTIHKDIDAPEARLMSYSRKMMVSSQVQVREFNISNSIFPTCPIHQTKSILLFEDEKQEPEQQNNEQEQQEQTPQDEQEQSPQKIKVFLKDDIDVQRQQSKSFEVKQIYQQYNPTNSEIEVSLQQRWLTNRQKELKEKKEDQEMVESMVQWSKNRSRIQKEINRRTESQHYGSRFKNLEDMSQMPDSPLQNKKYFWGKVQRIINLKPLPTIINQSTSKHSIRTMVDLETRISQQKINNVKKNYASLLNISALDIQNDPYQQSLSVYGCQDIKQRSISQKNKITNILEQQSPDKVTEEQIKEVLDIKNRMAKHKIVVPLQKIMTGIIAPAIDKDGNDKIPDIGAMLISNPFDISKKKKKKKKRKD